MEGGAVGDGLTPAGATGRKVPRRIEHVERSRFLREEAARIALHRGEHLFELLNAKLSEFIGPNGTWSLVRRTPDDTDQIFHAMLTHQIAADLTRSVLDERDAVAVVVPAENEPLALSWEPAPLVVWADPVVVAEDQSDAAAVPSIESPSELEARAA